MSSIFTSGCHKEVICFKQDRSLLLSFSFLHFLNEYVFIVLSVLYLKNGFEVSEEKNLFQTRKVNLVIFWCGQEMMSVYLIILGRCIGWYVKLLITCTVNSEIFARVYFRETSHMRSFVKLKHSQNVTITLSLTNILISCTSREFLTTQIRLLMQFAKISKFTVTKSGLYVTRLATLSN